MNEILHDGKACQNSFTCFKIFVYIRNLYFKPSSVFIFLMGFDVSLDPVHN